jgi:hypothetical protein
MVTCIAAVQSVIHMSRMFRVGNKPPHTQIEAVNWRSSAVLEKLVGAHLVTKFPDVYGTRKFITVFKKPPLVPILNYTISVHSLSSYCFTSVLISSFLLCLSLLNSLPFGLNDSIVVFIDIALMRAMFYPSHPSWFERSVCIWWNTNYNALDYAVFSIIHFHFSS